MDKLKYIKIKQEDGTYSEEVPVGVDASNVDMSDGRTLPETLGLINVDANGTVKQQLDELNKNKVNKIDYTNKVSELEIDLNELKNDTVKRNVYNNKISQLEEKDNLLQSQINQMIQNPGDVTEGNSELIDIRNNNLGFTYQTAGEAIREENLKSLLNSNNLLPNARFDSNYNENFFRLNIGTNLNNKINFLPTEESFEINMLEIINRGTPVGCRFYNIFSNLPSLTTKTLYLKGLIKNTSVSTLSLVTWLNGIEKRQTFRLSEDWQEINIVYEDWQVWSGTEFGFTLNNIGTFYIKNLILSYNSDDTFYKKEIDNINEEIDNINEEIDNINEEIDNINENFFNKENLFSDINFFKEDGSIWHGTNNLTFNTTSNFFNSIKITNPGNITISPFKYYTIKNIQKINYYFSFNISVLSNSNFRFIVFLYDSNNNFITFKTLYTITDEIVINHNIVCSYNPSDNMDDDREYELRMAFEVTSQNQNSSSSIEISKIYFTEKEDNFWYCLLDLNNIPLYYFNKNNLYKDIDFQNNDFYQWSKRSGLSMIKAIDKIDKIYNKCILTNEGGITQNAFMYYTIKNIVANTYIFKMNISIFENTEFLWQLFLYNGDSYISSVVLFRNQSVINNKELNFSYEITKEFLAQYPNLEFRLALVVRALDQQNNNNIPKIEFGKYFIGTSESSWYCVFDNFFDRDITEIQSDITEIQSDITEIQSDITEIQSDITEIQSDITEIQSDNHKDNILYGKKWAVCGDSVTYGANASVVDGIRQTYEYFIGERNNMNLVIDGVSGSTMAITKEYLEDKESYSIDYRSPFSYQRYLNVPLDSDYITIWFGINDTAHTNLGTINDTTNETYYGAWNVVLTYLITNAPNAKIGLFVTHGGNLNYRNAVRELAKKYGLSVFDIMGDEKLPYLHSRESDLSQVDSNIHTIRRNTWWADGSHPNSEGYKFMSTIIENWLRSL